MTLNAHRVRAFVSETDQRLNVTKPAATARGQLKTAMEKLKNYLCFLSFLNWAVVAILAIKPTCLMAAYTRVFSGWC